MGLVSGILGLPFAPVRGVVAAADQVRQAAEEQYYDPATIRAQLREVDRRRSDGEITDEEASRWEEQLVTRLMEGLRRSGGARGGVG